MTYTIKAPAKINLGLDVLRRREDGYHDLKMIMQTVALFDTLTFEINDGEGITLTCNNSELPVDDNNLVVKAVRMLADEFDIKKSFSIHLEKHIPVAAGMAGGSTDAAAAFIAVNDIFSLGLTKEQLMKRTVKLGADIPYCIMQGTALSEGIGDILTPLKPLDNVTVLIAKPPIGVSTGFVYTNLKLTPEVTHPDIDGIIRAMSDGDLPKWTGLLENILETVTIPAYPVIDDIKQTMLSNGALGSLMSGSGPTVFGIFDNASNAKKAKEACDAICNGMFTEITEFYTPECCQ